jgi:hypothetical protein
MPNPFDQFEENPFDQFEAAPVAPVKKPKLPTLSKTERFLKGLRDPVDGGAQLLERGVRAIAPGAVDAVNGANNWLADKTGLVGRVGAGGVAGDVAAAEEQYKQQAPEGMDWMRIAGNVMSPANLAGGVAGQATVRGAAGIGALSALANPTEHQDDFWTEKMKQAGIGAAGGAGVRALAGGASRVLSPNNTRNPDLALLRREGVQPTVGQTLGGGWNRTEEAMQGVPFVGDMIRGARDRTREQFNLAAINRATRPIGVNIDEAGQEGVGRAARALGHAYDDAGQQMGHFRLDRQGIAELRNLRNMAQTLPDRERATFDQAWRRELGQMGPRGTMLPDTWKRTDSVLGNDAAMFSGATDGYQKQLGGALREFQRVLRDTGGRQNPQARAAYEAADQGYANLVRVEGAANSAKLTGGNFTPGQLLMGVKSADRTVRDRATAHGDALMQDLGNAGQRVIGNKIPNSGTPERLARMGGAAGLTGGAAHFGLIEPTTAITAAIGTGIGMAAYTRAGQAALRVLTSSRPNSPQYQAAAQSLRAMAQHASPAGAQTAAGFFDEEQ